MNIEEAQSKKKYLEFEIATLLRKYTEETGLAVASLSFDDVRTMGLSEEGIQHYYRVLVEVCL